MAAEPGDIAPAPAAPTTLTPTSDSLDQLPSYGEQLIRMVFMLAATLVALIVLARVLPKWLGRPLLAGKSGAMRVLDTMQLEPRKRIYLVQVGQQVLLLGTSESGVHVLADQTLDGAALLERFRKGESAAGAVSKPLPAGKAPDSKAAVRDFAAVLSATPSPTDRT